MSYYKSGQSRSSRSRHHRAITAKGTIITIIIILIVTIAVSVAASFFLKPEYQIKTRITALANDYYENVFYDQLLKSDNYKGDPEQALQPYTTTGLAPLTLRQLLLRDEAKTSDDAAYLLQYCDENETSVTLYPDSPYTKTSYHVEYTYSCNF